MHALNGRNRGAQAERFEHHALKNEYSYIRNRFLGPFSQRGPKTKKTFSDARQESPHENAQAPLAVAPSARKFRKRKYNVARALSLATPPRAANPPACQLVEIAAFTQVQLSSSGVSATNGLRRREERGRRGSTRTLGSLFNLIQDKSAPRGAPQLESPAAAATEKRASPVAQRHDPQRRQQ